MITGIIMASGFSRRMKKNKLTIKIDGDMIIEKVIKAAKESKLDQILLIYRTEEIRELGLKYDLKTIYNPNAILGQSESVKLGVENSHKSSAYMFFVADQPFLNTMVIDRLIDAYSKEEKITIPYFAGKFGMPLIFPNGFRKDLLKTTGDKGGREIIRDNPSLVQRVDFTNEKLGMDIDSPQDLIEGDIR